jgi:hypothetical protein
MNAAFSQALLDPARSCPPGLRAWNGSDPAVRFAVHRNNVIVSLVDALADNLPVVQALVGETFFRAMAARFVRQSPPDSPVLAFYGDAMPGFIEQFAPARSVPYLADMARLEMARQHAVHAADADPVAAAVLAQAVAQGKAVADLRLGLHPSLVLLASPFAVVSLWAAHQGDAPADDALAAVDPNTPETALIVRDGLEVVVHGLSPGAAAFVAALQAGCDLGTAGAAGAGIEPGFDLPALLALLIRHGAFTSTHPLQERHP